MTGISLPERQGFSPPSCDRGGPLFGSNRIKLAVFGFNLSSAIGVTAAKDRHEIDWRQNVRLVQAAERAGFDAVAPIARWRGFEGATNPWGRSFETYTWAAGLASVTSRIGIFCTSHILTVSPVMAAKQMSTIDHISGGRAALNVVAGWFKKELDMFGVGELDHDARYAYGDEWMEVLMRLWTQEEAFDFDGRFIKVKDGYQQPKSVQSPRVPIMSAALSPVGHDFAARWADIAFVAPNSADLKGARQKVEELREAADKRGRKLKVWAPPRVFCAASEAAAREEIRRCFEVENDLEAQANSIDWFIGGSKAPPELRERMMRDGQRGVGCNLVGSPGQVAEQIAALSEAGVDGLCLTWNNFEQGVPQFIGEVLPLLEKAGLRAPVGGGAPVEG